ncbi:hypothetical protein DUNSADRAFT_17881 [Dunaliella salina]|uniref:Encoded protein n=1 Tax=Dunaliella salina TaxID=3046 RepID=A0ABQ7G0Y8_DUNSA|nr:hypothetical protein DUNSADRAFT_17881 [Dunaliella salina]|eukprot:KAF5828261.1 hypothetical protein DUNSADRAFT_17881 [Dunaliella salina]
MFIGCQWCLKGILMRSMGIMDVFDANFKHVKVDAVKLHQRLALTAADFNTTLGSMAALCSDFVMGGPGPANKRKRRVGSKEGIAELSEEGEGSQGAAVAVKPPGTPSGRRGGRRHAKRMGSGDGNGKKRRKQRQKGDGGRDAVAETEHEQGEGTEGLELECWPATDQEDELVPVEDREKN